MKRQTRRPMKSAYSIKGGGGLLLHLDRRDRRKLEALARRAGAPGQVESVAVAIVRTALGRSFCEGSLPYRVIDAQQL